MRGTGSAELVMPNFAKVDKKTITTSTIDLKQFAGMKPLPGGYQYPISVKANITIVFPDGSSIHQDQTTVIQGVTHTLPE